MYVSIYWDRRLWKDFEEISQSVQSLSCVRLFVTIWDCSMPGIPIHHQLLELAQTHVHPVADAFQQCYPLSSPSPPAFHLSQHQGVFQWVSSSHQVAKALRVSASASVLPMNIQDWFPLGWTSLISSQSKGLSSVFPDTRVQKHQFFHPWLSLVQLSHPYMNTGKTIAWTRQTFVSKVNISPL